MFKRLTWLIATIMWMLLIFAFSAQPAKESNKLSTGVADRIVGVVENSDTASVLSLSENDSFSKLVEKANHILRKFAHVFVFLVLGILVYGLLSEYGIKKRNAFIYAVLICAVYAAGDELHQTFVPGRACRVTDVLLDTFGSLMGTLLMISVKKILSRVRSNKS